MPYLIRRPRYRRLLGAFAGGVVAVGAAPALASACTVQTAGALQPFAHYGDDASYTLAPGGSFTAGAPGWTLDNATVRGDWQFQAKLAIAPGGNAISAPLCASDATPTLRFYARTDGGGPAAVDVLVLWSDDAGQSGSIADSSVLTSCGWAPSQPVPLGTILPTGAGATATVRIEFVPSAAAVDITDLYIDPYSRS